MGRFQESAEDMAKESEIRLLVNCTDINMTNVRAIMHTKGKHNIKRIGNKARKVIGNHF